MDADLQGQTSPGKLAGKEISFEQAQALFKFQQLITPALWTNLIICEVRIRHSWRKKINLIESVFLLSLDRGFSACLGDYLPDISRWSETWVSLCNLCLKHCGLSHIPAILGSDSPQSNNSWSCRLDKTQTHK